MYGHNGVESCACGIPNRASDHVSLVIGRDVPGGTETNHVDAYTCAEHTPTDDHAADVLHPDISADGWTVLESEITRIR